MDLSVYEKCILAFAVVSILSFSICMMYDTPEIEQVSDYSIVFTHIFVLPTIYVVLNTRWLYILILVTVFFSLLYHVAKLGNVGDELTYYKLADMASQAILIWVTVIVYIFEDMPMWGIPFILLLGLVVAAFGTVEVANTNIDSLVAGTAILLLTLYIIHKALLSKCSLQDDYFVYKRKYKHVIIGFLCFCVAFVFYSLDTLYVGSKYNFLHSCWHVAAYVSLYFTFSSRKDNLQEQIDEIRIKRTSFAYF